MAYIKLNKQTGEILTASDISHIEDGIYNTYDKTEVDNKINENKSSLESIVTNTLDGKSFKYLTQSEYDILSDTDKNNENIVYCITDNPTVELKSSDGSRWLLKVDNSGVLSTEKINVTTVNVTGITLNKSTTTVNSGSTDTLVATILPSNATNKSVTWTSSNTSIATVSNGVVTGVANGSCTITCTSVDGGYTATCSITVQTATISVTSVSLNKSTATIVNGSTEQLTATVLPSNATNKNVTWSSSNTSIATVSASGLVTGVGVGSATITVTTADGNKTSTCSVTIASSSIAVTSIALNKSTSTLTVPNTEQLTVTFTPSNATNQNVTWSSSDNTIASVSNGLVTSLKAGLATITATSVDGSKTATCSYTISSGIVAPENFTNYIYNAETFTNPTTTSIPNYSSYYAYTGLSKSVNSGVATYTKTNATATSSYLIVKHGVGDNKIYYVRCYVRSNSNLIKAGKNPATTVVATNNEWTLISYIITDSNAASNGLQVVSTDCSTNDVFEVKEMMKINLTEIYGAGNEPDKATCDSIFTTYKTGLTG